MSLIAYKLHQIGSEIRSQNHFAERRVTTCGAGEDRSVCLCVCVCVRFCVCTVLQSFVCCYCYCCCSYYHLNHKYSSLLLFLMLFLSPTILILIHSLGFYSLSILICTAKDIAVATVKAFLSRYFFRYNIFYIHFFPNYFYLLISCVFFCTQLSLTPPLYS